jgi:hypothetical protein
MLTLEEYNKIPVGTIFREGISTNSPTGIFMVRNDENRLLKWVAIKRIEGWCIYTHWHNMADSGYVVRNGDKVNDTLNISKLVSCEPALLQLYIK